MAIWSRGPTRLAHLIWRHPFFSSPDPVMTPPLLSSLWYGPPNLSGLIKKLTKGTVKGPKLNVDDPELPICKTNACRHAGREKNATTWQRTNLDIRAHSRTVHDTLGVQHSASNLCCLIFSTILVHLSSFSGTWSNKRKLNTSKMHSLPHWRTKCSMIQTPASAVADHRFSVFTSIYHDLLTVSDQAKTNENSLLSISY